MWLPDPVYATPVQGQDVCLLPPSHLSPVYRARETGAPPNRSPPGGQRFLWILGLANNRLIIADFRDVCFLAV